MAARSHLIDFTTYTFPMYVPETVHYLMAEALEKVVSGDIEKLMIFAPPGHGKSELVSRRLPAFWFGHRPNDSIIMVSYDSTLAVDSSKQARSIVEGTEYQTVWPEIQTDHSSRAGDLWRLDAPHRGRVRASGMGGGITGHPATVGLIDDPVKNRRDANSSVIRKRDQGWWTSSYRTRVRAGGAHVLIMTRWHYDDLAGWLLKTQGGRDYTTGEGDGEWTVLRIPAIAEHQNERDENSKYLGLPIGLPDPLSRKPGAPLAPGMYPLSTLLKIKNDVGSRDWASLYQGVPRPSEGRVFLVTKIRPVAQAPARMRKVRYWDFAATDVNATARTAGALMGEKDGEYFILDVKVGEWSPGTVQQEVLRTAKADGKGVPVWFEQEPGSAGVFVKNIFKALLVGFSVWADKVTGKKEIRWLPFAAQVEGGNVRIVEARWNAEVIDELDMQPDAPQKDITDALSGAFAKLYDKKEFTTMNIDFYNPTGVADLELSNTQDESPLEDRRTPEEVEQMFKDFEAKKDG